MRCAGITCGSSDSAATGSSAERRREIGGDWGGQSCLSRAWTRRRSIEGRDGVNPILKSGNGCVMPRVVISMRLVSLYSHFALCEEPNVVDGFRFSCQRCYCDGARRRPTGAAKASQRDRVPLQVLLQCRVVELCYRCTGCCPYNSVGSNGRNRETAL